MFRTSGHYPNLLDPKATATFIDLTHAAYPRRLGPLADAIDVFHANELNLMTLWFDPGDRPGGEAFALWEASLPERFRAANGYDLLPRLPALFGGDDDAAKVVRRRNQGNVDLHGMGAQRRRTLRDGEARAKGARLGAG